MIINSVIAGGSGKVEGTAAIKQGNSKTFTRYDGDTSNVNYVTVNYNFDFEPSLIVLTLTLEDGADITTLYKKDGWTTDSITKIKVGDDYYYRLTGNARVSRTGFQLPIHYFDGDATAKWTAYE